MPPLKNVTFITTGQPTTNPRLVKEVDTLIAQGYNVKVICCFYQYWAQAFDVQITRKYPGIYTYCGGSPIKGVTRYYLTRIRQKLAFILSTRTKKFGIAENAISRTHAEALKFAKKFKSDLYIAHNLGALPAAVIAARFHGAKVGYDAEDMHSGQFTTVNDPNYLLNCYIEEKYFPATNYFTVASPLIGEEYRRLYPYLAPVVIDNVFPRVRVPFKSADSGPLRLFWFSQTVGPERGLEAVIIAMAQVRSPVELHLLGFCSSVYRNELYALAAANGLGKAQLYFHDPVPADKLFSFASGFHIGIAGETGTTLNRDICLTNKLFVYVQTGLAVLASDTRAQSLFLRTFPGIGILYPKDGGGCIASAIGHYANNREILTEIRKANYQLGQKTLNWENESEKFLAVIHRLD